MSPESGSRIYWIPRKIFIMPINVILNLKVNKTFNSFIEISIYHIIHPFKMYISVVFSIFTGISLNFRPFSYE